MIYALCRKIEFAENLRVFGVKIWTGISIRVKNLTFSMSAVCMLASIACKVFVTNQTIRFQVNDYTRPADTWVIDRK